MGGLLSLKERGRGSSSAPSTARCLDTTCVSKSEYKKTQPTLRVKLQTRSSRSPSTVRAEGQLLAVTRDGHTGLIP